MARKIPVDIDMEAILNFDGESKHNHGRARVGGSIFLLMDRRVLVFAKRLRATSNNVAECETQIQGLEMAKERGLRKILILSDSMLKINQVSGKWAKVTWSLVDLLARAQKLTTSFDSIVLHHIPRRYNMVGTSLSRNITTSHTCGNDFIPPAQERDALHLLSSACLHLGHEREPPRSSKHPPWDALGTPSGFHDLLTLHAFDVTSVGVEGALEGLDQSNDEGVAKVVQSNKGPP
eukprot:Gb_15229 [translate_table: standard]